MSGDPNCSHSPYWHDDGLHGNASSSSSSLVATPSPEQEFACGLFDFLVETVSMGTLCAFGFVGNTLSAVCLRRDKSKSATPFLLISLALADTLFLVTALLLRVVPSIPTFTGLPSSSLVSDGSLTAYIGKYVYPWAMIANTGTIYVTVLVTVNRYISVCKPYDASSLCSIPNARRQVVVVWLLSLLFNVPRFFEYDIVKERRTIEDCDTVTVLRSLPTALTANRVYQLVYVNSLYFLIMFLVPLVSLIGLNYNLIMALRETRRRRETMKGRRPGFHVGPTAASAVGTSSRSEDDITLMLIVVVVIFVVAQGPALVTQILFEVLDNNCPSFFFFYQRISDLLVVANSSVNFIVYCFCSRRFRRILLSLLVRGRNPRELDTCEGGTAAGGPCNATAQTVEVPATSMGTTTVRYSSRREAGGGGGGSGGRNGAPLAFIRRLTERKVVLINDSAFELQETRPIVE